MGWGGELDIERECKETRVLGVNQEPMPGQANLNYPGQASLTNDKQTIKGLAHARPQVAHARHTQAACCPCPACSQHAPQYFSYRTNTAG